MGDPNERSMLRKGTSSVADYGTLLVLLVGNDFLFFGLASGAAGLAFVGAALVATVLAGAPWLRSSRTEVVLLVLFLFGAHAFAIPLLAGAGTDAWVATASGALLAIASLLTIRALGRRRDASTV